MTRTRSITFLAGAALTALVALVVAGGGGGGGDTSASKAPPKTTGGQAATVGASDAGLGKILVDSTGRTLYQFEKDSGTKSVCTGACADA